MVFFTRKVHRRLGGNFTFLILTDREDLDTQIYKTFAGCGAEKLEALEIEDVDVEQRLEQELKRDYHIITAEKRPGQVARDFVTHYSNAWDIPERTNVCCGLTFVVN